ncbi:hypothetical protein MDAP_002395 [Mitosporidium daphniae]
MNSHFKTMFDSCGSEIPGLFEAMSQETINTQFAQMLQFATSIATLNRMFQLDLPPLIKKDQSKAFIFAGHSLGDITALVAANFLTQEQGVAIVGERAKAMSEFSPNGIMVSVRLRPKISFSEIRMALMDNMGKSIQEFSKDGNPEDVESSKPALLARPSLAIACYNATDQIILSGTPTLVTSAIKRLTDLHLFFENSSKKLPVSGAFHSPLMNEASDKFGKSLEQIQFAQTTRCKNHLSSYFSSSILTEMKDPFDSHQIKAYLRSQIISPVYWTQTIDALVAKPCNLFIEVGNRALTALLKKKCPQIPSIAAQFDSEADEQRLVDSLWKFASKASP